jgi:gliding motility-associated-like protein
MSNKVQNRTFMRFALQFAATLLTVSILATNAGTAQTCPTRSVVVSNDTGVCPGQCVNLQVLSSSTSLRDLLPTYTGSTIPYAPYPFVGSNIVSIPVDDQFASNATPLPFSFCWWGVTQNTCLIGSNGQVSFTTSLAGQYCPWPISGPLPGANSNGSLNSIMGAWYDMYPVLGGTISYAVYGTAPCRAFVVSWNQIPMFSCNSSLGTQQIVMYETSNVIDIYIQSKPNCATWNSGYSTVGIQNAAGTVQYTAPGYNPNSGAISNFAYRFTPNTNPNGNPTITYTWTTLAGANVGSGTSISVCPTTATTYICKAHFVTGCGAIDAYDTVTVNIGADLGADFSFSDSSNCFGDTFKFVNMTPGPNIDSSFWDFGDGSPVLLVTGGNSLINVSHVYTVAGAHNVRMICTNSACRDTATYTINVKFGTQTPNFTYDVHLGCDGDSVFFQNLTTISTGVVGSSAWSLGDNSTKLLSGTNALDGFFHVYTAASTYNVTLINTSGFCIDTVTLPVTINHNPIVAAFTPDRDSICRGTLVNFNNFSTGDGITCNWNFGDNLQSITYSPTHIYGNVNQVTTVLTVTDSVGCVKTASHDFTVLHISVHAPFPDTVVCLKDSMLLVPQLESQSYFSNFSYAWTPVDNIGRSDTFTAKFFSTLDSTYKIKITVTAAAPFGCITDDSFYIHARAPITITTCEDQDIEFGKSVRLHAHGAYYYFWQPVNFLDNPNMRDPVASPEATTKFTVIGYSEGGCTDSAHVNVHVRYPSHYVCSAFSPNGDGKNDKFRIINMHFQKLLEFRVFNRWGEEVFNTLDPSDGWDGTWNGQPCDIGNYHYMVKIVSPDGELITDIGDITLVR